MFLRSLKNIFDRFGKDRRGNIAIITTIALVPMVGAVGFGIDYTRAVTYRMKLDAAANAATLAGVEAARAFLLTNTGAPQAEIAATGQTRATTVFSARVPASDVDVAIVGVAVKRVGNTLTANLQYSGSVKTVMANVLNFQTLKIGGSATSSGAVDPATDTPGDPNLLINENFDSKVIEGKGNRSWAKFANYNNWATNNGGVEIGNASQYGAAPPNGGKYVAELDSDANGYIAKKVFLPAGEYELRYLIKDRIAYFDYAPAYLCGTTSADVDWANSTKSQAYGIAGGYQTNRVSAYIESATSDTPPDSFDPSTKSLVDVCVVTGGRWIERSVKLTTTVPGFYWVAFQAEGQSDGYGSVLTGIRLCRQTCSGNPLDSYPWAKGTVLFSDNFETPAGTADSGWLEKTLDSSGANIGWTNLPAGWTTWPENQVDFKSFRAQSGVYSIELDANTTNKNGRVGNNRGISRKFILPPGYYEFSYYYDSHTFSPSFLRCGIAEEAANIAAVAASNTTVRDASTSVVRAFFDPDRLFSHPESEPTLYALARWRDPDGQPESKPRLPSKMVDSCVSGSGWFSKRTIRLKIVKSDFYWLTLQASGKDDYQGGIIDDLSLVALGGLSMTPPSDAVTVTHVGDAPGTVVVNGGLRIVSN